MEKRYNTIPLYTILFYYRSSWEERMEDTILADAGMGFFDKAVRE